MSSTDPGCGSRNFNEDSGTGHVEVVDVFNEGPGFGEDGVVGESKARVDRDGNPAGYY